MRSKWFVVLSISMTSGIIFAQDNPTKSAPTYQLESITVTGNPLYDTLPSELDDAYTIESATVGTKIPSAVHHIPQSVSIVTQQMMRDRNVQSFDQLASKIPGLRVLENDDGRSSVFARGYEYDEYHVDGLPAPMQSINGTLPMLAAFDRVEVMRGPSGLFNSGGEMGGVVNFVRKRPLDILTGNVALTAGNLHQYGATADINQAWKNIGARLIASTNSKTPKVSQGRNHAQMLYGALDIDLAEKTTLGLAYLYQQRHLKPDNGLPVNANRQLLTLPNHDFYGANWNHFDMRSHDFFIDLKHGFHNGAYGTMALRYSDRDSNMNYAFAQSALNPSGRFTGAGLGGNVQQKAWSFDMAYSQPFRLWGNVSEYVVGVDARHFSTDTTRGRSKFVGMSVWNLNHLPYRDILANSQGKGLSHSQDTLTGMGIYGKLTLRPIKKLALIVGARAGNWKINHQNKVNGQSQTRTEHGQITAYGGWVYDIDPHHHFYGSYSSLYTPQTEIDRFDRLLKARQGQQYEIGIKGNYADDLLQMRLSLFQITDKNTAIAVPTRRYSEASGRRKVKGIEAEINGEITPKWKISAGYAYMQSHVQQSQDKQEGMFLLMPKHLFNLWSTYQIHPKWNIGAGVSAMSSFESSQKIKTSGYAVVDAMASYQINAKTQLQFNINNIFNRNYYKRVGSIGTFNMPGEGRNMSVQLRYDF